MSAILLSALVPGRTNRAILVGMTGCGKTTLAEHLCAQRNYVVAYDSKGLLSWPGYQVVTRAKDLPRCASPRITYRPDAAEMADPATADMVCDWVYRRTNTTLYIDEVYGVVERGIPTGLLACVTRGREHGVEVWSSCQRPSRIPLALLSEAEHYYVFRLALDEDRRRIEELCGVRRTEVAKLPKRHFLAIDTNENEVSGPLALRLPEGA